MDLIRQLGVSNVVLDGGSLEVVQALRREESCWANYGHLIEDAKAILQLSCMGTKGKDFT